MTGERPTPVSQGRTRFETIMHEQLVSFISDNNILFDCQFGFRSKYST